MLVEFVVGSRSCYAVFSPGTPVFLLPQQPSFPKFNSTWKQRTNSSGCATEIPNYLFILYFSIQYGNTSSGRPILTEGQAQTPPIPKRAVYSNSRASVDPQGNRLCIIFTSLA